VARVSGDEFVVLLTDVQNEDDAALVAAKVRNSIGTPLRIEAHEFVLAASIGIALYPRDGTDAETLLRNADAALYRAKEHGRDCFQFFAPDMNERVVRYLAIERELREALDTAQFRLEYQPIVRLDTGEAIGAEALLRWRRPDGSTIGPAEFIPIAEESGLIVPIGRWVFETAARQASRWNRERGKPFFVSVNLSARQFRDPELLGSIRAALQAARVDASLIKVEITESTVMQNPEEAVKTLRALKALGVSVVVDDFGTGYSSLAYLKRFPIDTLKIDRSFVSGLPEDAGDRALCRAVLDLGRGLGMEVVAEGVETRGQAKMLKEGRCPLAQGYFFGRPGEAASLSPRATTSSARSSGPVSRAPRSASGPSPRRGRAASRSARSRSRSGRGSRSSG
jgi:EAL domain-containing protein (putative c-di-GMP-specific phosphodiesterase class I)